MAESALLKTNGGIVRGSKVPLHVDEVNELNERLRDLEEEAAVIKQDFLEAMEVQKKLMNEIRRDFHDICCRLYPKYGIVGEKSCDGVLISRSVKARRAGTGLSQVLCQELDPPVVLGQRSKSKS